MHARRKSRFLHSCSLGGLALSVLAMGQFTLAPAFAGTPVPGFVGAFPPAGDAKTQTPIKHVIVIIGENRSFDHVFATYVPPSGQTVNNLLSEGIITLDSNKNAIPGPNYKNAQQLAAQDLGSADAFLLSPPKTQFPASKMPAPLVGGAKVSYIYKDCGSTPVTECTVGLTLAQQSESGLPSEYYPYLLSGGTGLTSHTPDTRITGVTNTTDSSLPPGPFQLTNTSTFNALQSADGTAGFDYDAYSASPVHRFYQMWQQLDCSVANSSSANPSGCNQHLFAWVEVTVGAGTNGAAQPSNFSTEYSPSATTTGEGSTALGFYNVQKGDVPYFNSIVQKYAMSDNFHQSVNGGTGANHIMFGHADAIWFSDGNGNPAKPPENVEVYQACNDQYNTTACPNPDAGTVQQIENPNPASGTNNWYTEDGYGNSNNAGYPQSEWTVSPVSGGGSYTNCSDASQPGVKPILNYLKSLNPPIDSRCESGHYYLLNNYNPGYFGNGNNAYTDQNPANTPFTIPPSSVASIGDSLNANSISWKYYGDQWNNYLPDPYQINYGTPGPGEDEYCNICNPFQYDTSIMSHPDQVAAHIQDSINLYADIDNGTLPAVSVVKPSGLVDGHPSSSKLDLFEGFCKKIIDQVESSQYASDTVIFITEDEGGGYYDSGYVQPLDFFGDGTRIPLIVISPYAKHGYISHDYADHVSIIKFIERNWSLPPITSRSRDNFPNPVTASGNPYVPVNSPALSDLFDFFDFSQF